jgi:hypothetical protein
MKRNNLLYNAAVACIAASKIVRPIDQEFAIILLDKAEEYKNKVVIDEEIEKEVLEFEKEIGKGL